MPLPIVVNSNLGPILPRFRDIAGFLLVFHPNFRGVPFGLDNDNDNDVYFTLATVTVE